MGAFSSLLPLLARAATVMRRFPGGRGAIDGGALVFTCHRVAPLDPSGLPANEGLKVSPGFLELFVRRFRSAGYRFVCLDELAEAVKARSATRGLVALTFDDGYRDNLDVALPLLEGMEVPFTVFVACAMVDGTAFLWWYALEAFLKSRSWVRLADGRSLPCGTAQERERTFMEIRDMVLGKDMGEVRSFLDHLLPGFGSEVPSEPVSCSLMDRTDVKRMSQSRFATIGSHTVTHPNLAALTDNEVRTELSESKEYFQQITGKQIRHLAFPFGGPLEAGDREYRLAFETGYVTAATTNAGSVAPGETGALHRLPRIYLREGADPALLIAENRARIWLRAGRGLLRQ
jgi:peptidoglycan/xylan/chitin deacetylase (PgdA/CDA1 family)